MNTAPDENKNLPEFLKNTVASGSVNPENLTSAEPSALKKTFITISLIWFLLVLVYIQFALGWGGLTALLPGEFMAFLAWVFIPLLLILWLVALLKRTSLTANQALVVEKSLKKILYSQDENALTDIITQALKSEIKNLTAVSEQLTKQTGTLKEALAAKAEDFSKVGAVLESCFTSGLDKLSDASARLVKDCQAVAAVAEQSSDKFSSYSATFQTDAKNLSDELNPLINETLATAEHLKNILRDSKNQIEQTTTYFENFAAQTQKNIESVSAELNANGSKLEKTFLQTADNCEEIYKRLDSGISHIENSLKTHKELAAEQSALLDKNSAYLDGKLGEYGRLISMEVEAMIERSSTLDTNVKSQIQTLSSARDSIEKILDGANNSLEQKSAKAVKNISKIVETLESELSKLNEFIKKTENKNGEIQSAAEKITHKIGDISADLSKRVDELKNNAVEAIDKFNEVSGEVQKNTSQLKETANVIVAKGKEGTLSLENQRESIVKTVEALEDVKSRIAQIGQALQATSDNTAEAFNVYKAQIDDIGSLINRQVEVLNDSRLRSEEQLYGLKRKYEELSVDNFMDQSAGVIRELENLSVDINRMFNTDEDDLWKKFYNGDHGVFARYVVKNLNRKQIVKIREEYEKNQDFRQMADKYMQDFEVLMDAAHNSEKPEVLLAILSNTDIGKIYYVIARSLDKLN